jgi:hypothetical protein
VTPVLNLWDCYYAEWQQLLAWCRRHAADPTATLAAAAACSAWFTGAALGEPTVSGPYANLYYLAADELWRHKDPWGVMTSAQLVDDIPIPGTRRSCELARLYSVVGMARHYGRWNTADVAYLAEQIKTFIPESWGWIDLAAKIIDGGSAGRLLRCAVEALDQHSCTSDDYCITAGRLAADEDLRGEQWICDQFA